MDTEAAGVLSDSGLASGILSPVKAAIAARVEPNAVKASARSGVGQWRMRPAAASFSASSSWLMSAEAGAGSKGLPAVGRRDDGWNGDCGEEFPQDAEGREAA